MNDKELRPNLRRLAEEISSCGEHSTKVLEALIVLLSADGTPIKHYNVNQHDKKPLE